MEGFGPRLGHANSLELTGLPRFRSEAAPRLAVQLPESTANTISLPRELPESKSESENFSGLSSSSKHMPSSIAHVLPSNKEASCVLKVPGSDAIQNPGKYVLFDQCDNEGMMLLRSNAVPDLPAVKYDASDVLGNKDFTGTARETIELFFNSRKHDTGDTHEKLQAYKEAMIAAFGELQRTRQMREDLLGSRDRHVEQPPAAPTSSSSWHENTEDLEALMDSEDECNSESVSSGLTQSSHPACLRGRMISNEVESGGRADGSYLSSEGESNGIVHQDPGEASLQSTSSRWKDLLSIPSRISKRSRSRKGMTRHKIRVLKGIIPGGERMGTALVLDEVIRYIKSLQTMVEELEAGRGVDVK